MTEFIEFTDLSDSGLSGERIAGVERSLVLRAINTERNNLVHWYGYRMERDGSVNEDSRGMLNGYSDRPWRFDDGGQVWDDQISALNRFEARLLGCECCFNNANDFEHYHSPVCSPDYVEVAETTS